ncbi:MAG: TolC family protein [Acidobacteria bacterium]|nr:TolC family protein [Acidobacteriota bacterium]
MKKSTLFPLCLTGAFLVVYCFLPRMLLAQDPVVDGVVTPNGVLGSPGARRLTLNEAVALALKNNRDVLLAQSEVARAAAAHKEAKAPFRPAIFLGSGLAATKGFPLSIEGSAPSIFQVSAQQSFLNPNLRNLERQAGQMEAAVTKTLEQKRDDVVAQTVLTYLDLDRSRRSLQYVKGQAQSLSEAEQIMAERVRAGLDAPIEDTRAKLNTARSRSAMTGVQNQIAMLEFTLRDLTGIPQSDSLALEPAEVPALPADDTLEQLIARARENNEGIRALEDEVHAKQYQVRSEEGSNWPRVNLVAQYGLFSEFNNFARYFQRFSRNNITAGISIMVPLWDRYRTSALISKAEAELAAARLRLSDARATIARQIRQIWADAQQQSASREVARLELELSRRSLDVVLAQFEEGRVNRLSVEHARGDENQKWITFLDASYQSEKARLELLRLSGEIRNVFR